MDLKNFKESGNITYNETANILRENIKAIIKDWEKRTKKEVKAASTISTVLLINSLPAFLEQLALTLSGPFTQDQADINADVAFLHGAERAAMKEYYLDSVIYEYQILREVIIEKLSTNESLSPEVLMIIHGFIDRGIRKASNRFIQDRNLFQERARLFESEEKFRTIADAMPQMIWSTLPNGFHDYYNKQWYIFTGVPEGSTDGEGWNGMFHPEDQERAWGVWSHSLATGEPYQIEYRLRHHSGEYRWTLGRALPIKNSKGEIIRWMGTCTDIQELRTNKDQLDHYVEDLHLERELIEKFVATLTHDLRTPLTSAKLSAQLILKKSHESEFVQKHAQRIVESITRTDQMIQDLLDSNRIRAGETLPLNLEECDFVELVKDVIAEATFANVNAIKYIGPPSLVGFWDIMSVRRLMDNLINNALKYGDPKKEIEVIVKDSKNELEFSVHNFGNPIAPEDLESLFTIHQRTHAAMSGNQKGWGIGLTVVQGVAEAHGGHVTVKSSLREGTTFTALLPITHSRELNFRNVTPGGYSRDHSDQGEFLS
jgi:PAS domain S-box-containing protein